MYNIAIPASVTWLQTADPEDVRFEHFIQVCRDYIEYQRVCGVPEERFQIPEQFVQEGDLQSFMNVVSWWPKDAPRGYHAPTLSGLMQSVIMVDASRPSTFLSTLENAKARIEPWLKLHKHSLDNPNETPEDKKKRLNREGVARFRAKNRVEPVDDPDLAALIKEAKLQASYVTEGRKWLRGVERSAKLAYDAAVGAAKVARAATVSNAEHELTMQITRADAAQALVDDYLNK